MDPVDNIRNQIALNVDKMEKTLDGVTPENKTYYVKTQCLLFCDNTRGLLEKIDRDVSDITDVATRMDNLNHRIKILFGEQYQMESVINRFEEAYTPFLPKIENIEDDFVIISSEDSDREPEKSEENDVDYDIFDFGKPSDKGLEKRGVKSAKSDKRKFLEDIKVSSDSEEETAAKEKKGILGAVKSYFWGS